MGGVLERVRDVVLNTLGVADAMGENTSNAWINFASGEAAYENAEYKLAFGFYRRSYQQATD